MCALHGLAVRSAVLAEREACAITAENCLGDFEADTPSRTVSKTKAGVADAIRAKT